jgi:hypothetical protein
MKRCFFLLLALLFIIISPDNTRAQSPDNDGLWDLLLDDVNIRYRYSFTHEGFIPRPRFGDQLKSLDSTIVSITGFYLPANITGSSFVVSYYPMALCFFCSGAGIESVVVMYANEAESRRFSNLRTDDFIEVRGRLELNDDVNKNLFYILHDAEFIRIMR